MTLAALLLVATGCGDATADVGASSRDVVLVLEGSVDGVEAGEGPLELWLPLPATGPHQEVVSLEVTASIPGGRVVDPVYGNVVWRGRVDQAPAEPVTFRVSAEVRRHEVTGPSGALAAGEKERFLVANARVPVDGPLVDAVRADLPSDDGTPLARARTLFDFVLSHMEYKKVGSGWGTGSTAWACSARYGNCTDFHALFTSLARAEGLPTRFHIGYPLGPDAAAEVGGYHCWADVWIEGEGWLAIDASEAWKHPESRERWFGALPADRVEVSIGRDLELGQGGGPLNYFVAPYAEVGGRVVEGVSTTVRYGGASGR